MNTVKLARTAGDDPRSVAEYVAAVAQDEPPRLAWAEPKPTYHVRGPAHGRIVTFEPFVSAAPTWPADLPLVEARLFWAGAALHVVARGSGCRWVRIEEGDIGETVARLETSVLALRDRQRFGLEAAGDAPALTAIEYRQDGRLLAWRLIPNRAGEGACHA